MVKISILGFLLVILCLITRDLACKGETLEGNCLRADREALLDFKNGLKDSSNNQLSSWIGGNCCQWEGIGCENNTGVVISIDLHNPYYLEEAYENWSSMNLSGEIRPSLIELKSLRSLDLSGNSFEHILIPKFFGSLKNLQYLNLSNCGFRGAIPPTLGNLSNLQFLDLSSNESQLFVKDLEWMTNLASLRHLKLNYVNLSMVGSHWMEVFNKLSFLAELHLQHCGLSGSISSLNSINFTSLSVISIGGNFFRSKFPIWLLNLSNLVYIDVSSSQLYGQISPGLGELPNLQHLDLSWNENLIGSFSEFLEEIKNCSSEGPLPELGYLDLSRNQLVGRLPERLSQLEKLTYLDLSFNKLQGPIPTSFGTFKNLNEMRLGWNELNGSLPVSFGQLSELVVLEVYGNSLTGILSEEHFSKLSKLKTLWMDANSGPSFPTWLRSQKEVSWLYLSNASISGSIPKWFWNISLNLQGVILSHNQLQGTIPTSIGNFCNLEYLDLSFTTLTGILSEEHFSKLSKLKTLWMDGNSGLVLNFSSTWVPPFQLTDLGMASFNLGPSFPTWLRSQKEISTLDLSNASISGSIPKWFWNISFNMQWLNLSDNQLQGQLPNSLNFYGESEIDFSSNLFEGPIPFSIKGVYLLDLSHNKFSGLIPLSRGESMLDLYYLFLSENQIMGTIPDSIGHITSLRVIDFSRNNLTGSIPSTINNCSSLIVLDLGNNNLSGMLPKSLGQLQWLESLHLNDNKLSGELPSSFQNLSRLELLDLSYNQLSGKVPSWIGTAFINLVILNLRSNVFFGRLPSQLSNLSSLHVLDLAQNNLMGEIPVTLVELKAMVPEYNKNIYPLYDNVSDSLYEERLVVIMKGQSLEYTRTLSLVVGINLSDNNLSGELPQEITKLFGLVVLNLSGNHISGQIPESISMLHQLLSLDLSRNKLSGSIPSSMVSLTFLSYLNLSNNNFSGKIPFIGQMSTFNELAFVGNPNLCGAPLVTKCQDEDLDKKYSAIEDKNDGGYIDQWFYLSVGLGFAMGILVPYFVLATRKSWCETYFDFVDKIVKWLLRGRATYAKDHLRR
ncbi:Leucine-rich repeat receptor protein kinase MSL1 [Vitis vinifera]|uniref:Leucine-rich repeat receptor protein kinase MSL1 n=1 Tax=Vitis vinifera TaxID=29760 RepID=A0A438BSG1_VITVI|nr:Leucine-rich repeat receptor protein kinase MSL1 [Vitis vinifera]